MDLLTKIDSPYGYGDLYGDEIPKAKGCIFFVHGFHSSAKIWTSTNTGLMEFFTFNNFNCYAIDLSSPTTGSISILADYELAGAFQWITQRNPSKQCVIIAHSMGGLVTRYFLDKDENHPIHSPKQIADSKKLLSVALLATPNHGIALPRTKYRPATNNHNSKPENNTYSIEDHFQSNESYIKTKIKEILGSNSLKGIKKLNELIKIGPLELYADSSIIKTLNDHISANLWPELRWINIIGNLDIIVDNESAKFTQEEIDFLTDFHQNHFDVTHMRNPLSWLSPYLSKYYSTIDIKDIESNIEKLIPQTSYLIKQPIYADKQVQTYLGELILPLFS